MVYCYVPLCKSKKGQVNESFHEFPCDDYLKCKWLNAISRRGTNGEAWEPSDRSVVCSKHFTKEDFKIIPNRRILKVGSVPSIFPISGPVTRSKTARQKAGKKTKKSTSQDSSSFGMKPSPVLMSPPKCPHKIPQSTSFISSILKSQLNDIGESEMSVSRTCQYESQHLTNNITDDVHSALNKLDEENNKCSILSYRKDGLDHFGIYVASLLRSFPSQKAIVLHKKVLEIILGSQSESLQTGQKVEDKESTANGSKHVLLNSSSQSEYCPRKDDAFDVQAESSISKKSLSLRINVASVESPSITLLPIALQKKIIEFILKSEI